MLSNLQREQIAGDVLSLPWVRVGNLIPLRSLQVHKSDVQWLIQTIENRVKVVESELADGRFSRYKFVAMMRNDPRITDAIPMWFIAIALKILVTLIIDAWLLNAQSKME